MEERSLRATPAKIIIAGIFNNADNIDSESPRPTFIQMPAGATQSHLSVVPLVTDAVVLSKGCLLGRLLLRRNLFVVKRLIKTCVERRGALRRDSETDGKNY